MPFQDLDRFERSADRLWIRDGFFASAEPFPDAASWATYRRAGINQVVFGHTPVERPTLSHDGHALNLDTWRGQQVTLARLEPGRELRDAAPGRPGNAYLAYRFFLAKEPEAWLSTDVLRGPIPPG